MKKVYQKIFLFSLICSLFLFTSCNDAVPEPPQPAEVDQSDVTAATPVSPVSTPVSPIPTPLSAAGGEPTPEVDLSEPEQGLGTVGGIMLTDNPLAEGTLAPVILSPVYLAPLLYTEDGKAAFAGLDEERDPATATGPTGIFIFRNVPPGRYGLVVMHGVKLYLITDERGHDYVIDIEPNETLDLGEVYAELPPL